MATIPKYVYCIPAFLSLAAFVLACVGTKTCHFLQFASSAVGSSDPVSGEIEPVSLQFGYWYYQSYEVATTNDNNSTTIVEGSCDIYPPSMNIDNNWKAARGFNLVAIILGGSLLMLDIFQGCLSTKQKRSFRTGAVGYFVCFLCGGLSLLILDSNVCKDNILIEELNSKVPMLQFQETCSISTGGKTTIAATVMWFVASVGTALLHPAQRKDERRGEDDGLDEPLFDDGPSIVGV